MLNEINEYDFFKYLHNDEPTKDLFLTMIDKELLLQVDQCLKASISDNVKIDTDQKVIELILIFAATL